MRRNDSLWALPHAALAELTSRRPPRLELRGGATLEADEVLSLTAEIEPRPFPRCARRYHSQALAGLAVWRRRPVVLVEPGAAPPCLAAEPEIEAKEEEIHGDEIR